MESKKGECCFSLVSVITNTPSGARVMRGARSSTRGVRAPRELRAPPPPPPQVRALDLLASPRANSHCKCALDWNFNVMVLLTLFQKWTACGVSLSLQRPKAYKLHSFNPLGGKAFKKSTYEYIHRAKRLGCSNTPHKSNKR